MSVLRSKANSSKRMALWKNKSAEALLCPCCEVPSLCQSHCFVVIPERGLAMHVECREREKRNLRPMNVMVRHAWSHTRTIYFQEDAFSPPWRERGCQKKEHGPFWSLIFFLLNVYLHAMHEREEETWIIVHGCMGDKSHLMCSYFWGHREFQKKNKAIKIS